MVFEMAVIIGVFVYGGSLLDKHYGTRTPWFTAGLGLAGVTIALYTVLKQIFRWQKRNA